MHVSLNELALTSYKAAVGVGTSIGAAQDLSRAVAWLVVHGLPVVSLVRDVVKKIDEGRSVYGSVILGNGSAKWGPDQVDRSLSAVLLGSGPATLYMSLVRQDKASVLSLTELDVPLLQLPHFANITKKYNMLCYIELSTERADWCVLSTSNGKLVSGSGYERVTTENFKMRVSGQLEGDKKNGKLHSLDSTQEQNIYTYGCEVDVVEWGQLGLYAKRVLVGATERSRILGAGAEITDND